MANITRVQKNGTAATTAATATVPAWSPATGAGNLLVAVFNVVGATSAPSWSPGSGWNVVSGTPFLYYTTGNCYVGVAWKYATGSDAAPAAPSNSSASAVWSVYTYEFSHAYGFISAAALDVNAHSINSSTQAATKASGSTGALATTNDLAIAFVGLAAAGSAFGFSGNGITLDQPTTASTELAFGWAEQTAATAVNATASWTTSARNCCWAVTFQPGLRTASDSLGVPADGARASAGGSPTPIGSPSVVAPSTSLSAVTFAGLDTSSAATQYAFIALSGASTSITLPVTGGQSWAVLKNVTNAGNNFQLVLLENTGTPAAAPSFALGSGRQFVAIATSVSGDGGVDASSALQDTGSTSTTGALSGTAISVANAQELFLFFSSVIAGAENVAAPTISGFNQLAYTSGGGTTFAGGLWAAENVPTGSTAPTITWNDGLDAPGFINLAIKAAATLANRTASDTLSIADAGVGTAQTRNRTISDTRSISDAGVGTAQTRNRTGSDSLSIADAGAQTRIFSRSASDALSIADAAVGTAQTRSRTASEALSIVDSASSPALHTRTASEALSIADSAVGTSQARNRTASEALSIADASTSPSSHGRTKSDAGSIADAAAASAATRSRTVADPLSIADAATQIRDLPRTATETQSVADSAVGTAAARNRTATETLSAADSAVGALILNATASEALSINDGAAATAAVRNRTEADALSIADAASATSAHGRTAADSLSIVDAAAQTRDLPRSASESLSIADAAAGTAAARSRTEADTLSIADAGTQLRALSRSGTDALSIADAGAQTQRLARTSADALSIADSATGGRSNPRTKADALSFADTPIDTVGFIDGYGGSGSATLGIDTADGSGNLIVSPSTLPSANDYIVAFASYDGCTAAPTISGGGTWDALDSGFDASFNTGFAAYGRRATATDIGSAQSYTWNAAGGASASVRRALFYARGSVPVLDRASHVIADPDNTTSPLTIHFAAASQTPVMPGELAVAILVVEIDTVATKSASAVTGYTNQTALTGDFPGGALWTRSKTTAAAENPATTLTFSGGTLYAYSTLLLLFKPITGLSLARTASDTGSIVDAAVGTAGTRNRTAAETLSIADVRARAVTEGRSASEALSIADAGTESRVGTRTESEAQTITDAALGSPVRARTRAESLSFADLIGFVPKVTALAVVTNPAVNGAAAASSLAYDISAVPTGHRVIVVVAGDNVGTITPPSGWDDAGGDDPSASLSSLSVWIGSRVKLVGDTTFTWGFAAAASALAFGYDCAGVDTTAPVDVTTTPVGALRSTDPYTATSGTATAVQRQELGLLIAVGEGADGTSALAGTVAGFTKDLDVGITDNSGGFNLVQLAAYHANALTSSTTIGAQSVTFAGGNFSGFAHVWITQVVLRRAGAQTLISRTGADSGTFTDAAARAAGVRNRTEADTLSIADAGVGTSWGARFETDALSLGDAVSGAGGGGRTAAETASFVDAAERSALALARTEADSLSFTDASANGNFGGRSWFESLSSSDAVSRLVDYTRTESDAKTFAAAAIEGRSYPRTTSDTKTISDAAVQAYTHGVGRIEFLSFADDAHVPVLYPTHLRDLSFPLDSVEYAQRLTRIAIEDAGFGDSPLGVPARPRTAAEAQTIADAGAGALGLQTTLEDASAFGDGTLGTARLARTVEDDGSFVDAGFAARWQGRILADPFTIADAGGTTFVAAAGFADALAFDDGGSFGALTLGRTTEDDLAGVDVAGSSALAPRARSESLFQDDELLAQRMTFVAADDAAQFADSVRRRLALVRVPLEAFTFDDSARRRIMAHPAQPETLSFADSTAHAALQVRAAYDDQISLTDALARTARTTRTKLDARATVDAMIAHAFGARTAADVVAPTDAPSGWVLAPRGLLEVHATVDVAARLPLAAARSLAEALVIADFAVAAPFQTRHLADLGAIADGSAIGVLHERATTDAFHALLDPLVANRRVGLAWTDVAALIDQGHAARGTILVGLDALSVGDALASGRAVTAARADLLAARENALRTYAPTRTGADTGAIADAATVGRALVRVVLDVGSLIETRLTPLVAIRASADAFGLVAVTTAHLHAPRAVAETGSLSEAPTSAMRPLVTAADHYAPSEQLAAALGLARGRAEVLPAAEAIWRQARLPRVAADVHGALDVVGSQGTLVRAAREAQTTHDGSARGVFLARAGVDTFTLLDALGYVGQAPRLASDVLSPTDSLARAVALVRAPLDALPTVDTLARRLLAVRSEEEATSADETLAATAIQSRGTTEALSLADMLVPRRLLSRTPLDAFPAADLAVANVGPIVFARDALGGSDFWVGSRRTPSPRIVPAGVSARVREVVLTGGTPAEPRIRARLAGGAS